MSRPRIGWGLATVLALGACQAVTGLTDFEEGNPLPIPVGSDGGSSSGSSTSSTSSSSGSSGSDGGGDASDAATDGPVTDGAVTATLSGAVHFLESGNTVAIGTGADRTTLGGNGMFMLPLHGATGTAYDVRVISQPAGQQCWVQNGTGTIGVAGAAMEVRCLLVKTSIGTATTARSTNSSTYTAMDDVASIALHLDVPARTLLALTVPAINGAADAPYRLGIYVDGALVSEAAARLEHGGPNTTPVVVLAVPNLGMGDHVIAAYWRAVDGFSTITRPPLTPSGGALRPELDVVVLDSLSTFDRYVSTQRLMPYTTGGLGNDMSIGATPLTFTSTAQPALLVADVPDLAGDGVTALLLDGTSVARVRKSFNEPYHDQHWAPVAMTLTQLTATTHTTDVHVWGYNANANIAPAYGNSPASDGLGNTSKPLSLMGFLWKATANTAMYARSTTLNVPAVTAATWVNEAASAKTITVSKPSLGLAMFDLEGCSEGGQAEIEAALFVNNVDALRLNSGHVSWPPPDTLRANMCTRIGIVQLPTGSSTIDLKYRSLSANSNMSAESASFGVVVLE